LRGNAASVHVQARYCVVQRMFLKRPNIIGVQLFA
jgi:hypothetical protein